MRAKIITMLSVGWVVSFCAVAGRAEHGGGSGTAEDPYQIWTAEDMQALGADANYWAAHFKLMADIDLSDFDGLGGNPAFNIIGGLYKPGFVGQVKAQATFLFKFGTQGSGDGQFYYPADVAIDGSDDIIVADYSNHRIQVFDSSGNFLFKFGTQGSGDGQFYWPYGVAVNSSGDIIVADAKNDRIQILDSSGNFLFKFGTQGSGDGQLDWPNGVAVDSSGDIIVCDSGNMRIQVSDSSGNFLFKFGSLGIGDGQFNSPVGVTVDSFDNIIVADYSNDRIQIFDSSGNFLFKFGTEGSGDGQFNYPVGLAVDGSGNIIVTDYYNHRIQIFDSLGNFLFKFGTQGSGDGQFNYPAGVAVDSSGNIIVADLYNQCIQVFSTIPGNNPPIANAGPDQTVFVTETVTLNGSGSTDVDGDPLTFQWSFISVPSGSTATLSDPTAVKPTFVVDKPGTYVVGLGVNDGLVGSDPVNVTVEAISCVDGAVRALLDAIDMINDLPVDSLKNKNMKTPLVNKLNVGLKMEEECFYESAFNKLVKDVAQKMNGCDDIGEPDKNDWLITCEAQNQVYPVIIEAIKLLENPACMCF